MACFYFSAFAILMDGSLDLFFFNLFFLILSFFLFLTPHRKLPDSSNVCIIYRDYMCTLISNEWKEKEKSTTRFTEFLFAALISLLIWGWDGEYHITDETRWRRIPLSSLQANIYIRFAGTNPMSQESKRVSEVLLINYSRISRL